MDPRQHRMRMRRARRLMAGGVALAVSAGCLVGDLTPVTPALTTAARSMLRSQAVTPPMGFNDWNAFGCDVSAELIERTADAMVADGMAAAGYRYVDIDDCWMAGARAPDGALQADPSRFPDGIAAVAEYIHAWGLLFGLYADAGTATCAGRAGSYGHENQDARTFATWGVDLVKYDQCNIPWSRFGSMTHAEVDGALYTRFANAVAASGRAMVVSVCTGVDPTSDPGTWAPTVGNLWRTTPDITDSFASTVSIAEADVRVAGRGGPTRWADPDMLEIGNGGSTDAEYRAQFTLWAILRAPLLAGADLVHATAPTLTIYENAAVIAVDQDAAGAPPIWSVRADGIVVLTRQLSGGDTAIVLLNPTGTARAATLPLAPSGSGTTITDLWSGGVVSPQDTITVAAHATLMYRVSLG